MQSLGEVIFEWNPDKMSIPQARKFVSSIPTYNSSAIFQWGPQWVGERIVLEWEYMKEDQYSRLYSRYLDQEIQEYNPDNRGETFNVIVVDMTGELFQTGLYEQPYRENVKMTLEIRSRGITTTTTTTYTTSTTV